MEQDFASLPNIFEMSKIEPKTRRKICEEAGLFIYTAAPLLSDLLSHNISAAAMNALFIFEAHRVAPYSI